ncbi:glutathione S-transferase family protein [Vibrio algarum]|uniref:Glutathione S-transferase family protein n=1 Tax=Vibrio algarum TaxID=3020714 RepID=A0ABT4YXI9_9VIBR|nr:glutathione S-transferase family protein [Vibrio sp. KJ40-1]MDB1126092.1 glutathione S-transferase family protein [Vibrio sp. KJ40-1]
MQLIIGNKNYSSWSLRAWLMVNKAELTFEEILLPLDTPEFYREITKFNPAAKVPTLVDNKVTVWDSLAICEYINETYMNGRALPKDPVERAYARSISAEMHSGFNALRNEMPMNIRATRFIELSEQALKDIQRIDQIWSNQMNMVDGGCGWLFEKWSIADMMFAPVVMRFKTYQVKLSPLAQQYLDFVLTDPDLNRWIDEALKETLIVEIDEAGIDV